MEIIGVILFLVGIIGFLTVLGIEAFKFNFTVGLLYVFFVMFIAGGVMASDNENNIYEWWK